MFIGVPSAPKCRTTSGTPVAATVSVSTMRAVPFVPSCAKIICASLSRRSPHEPLAAQRPRQTPVMSLRSIGAARTPREPQPCWRWPRPAIALSASLMLAGVGWLLIEKVRCWPEAKCDECWAQTCQSLRAVPCHALVLLHPDIENITADNSRSHHWRRSIRPSLEPSSHGPIRAALGQGARRGPRLGGLTIRAVGRRPGRLRAALTATARRKCRLADGATLAAMARSLGSRLPQALVERLSQRDLANRLGIALPVVTVDREGRPHAMVLGYLELRAYDSGTLGLVVQARSASARNLAERGGGTLLILEPDAVVYVKSRVVAGPLDVAGAGALGYV